MPNWEGMDIGAGSDVAEFKCFVCGRAAMLHHATATSLQCLLLLDKVDFYAL